MAKTRRKVEIPPEVLKELEELDRRMEQSDREAEKTLAMVDAVQAMLRAAYQSR